MKELKKKLMILGTVYASGWDYRTLIRDMYWEGKLTMKDFQWGDRYRNEKAFKGMYDPVKKLAKGADQGHEWEWSTYAERVKVEIYVKKNRICIDLRMEKGDNFDGHKIGLKWKATFVGFPTKKLNKFRNPIESAWRRRLSRLFEDEEEQRRLKRMEEISNELLNQ